MPNGIWQCLSNRSPYPLIYLEVKLVKSRASASLQRGFPNCVVHLEVGPWLGTQIKEIEQMANIFSFPPPLSIRLLDAPQFKKGSLLRPTAAGSLWETITRF